MKSSTVILLLGIFMLTGVCSCKSKDLKAAIMEETCDCITKQGPGDHMLDSLAQCQQHAIDRNKPLLASQLKIDTGSNGAMVNLSLELAILLNAKCDFVIQQRHAIDSLVKMHDSGR